MTKGIKKAKSLLAIHMSGNNMCTELHFFIREALGIALDERKDNVIIETNH